MRPVVPVVLGVLAFFVLVSYAIARPATESLFLQAYSSQGLPAAWLAVSGAAALTVAVYNRLAARMDLLRLYQLALGGSAGLLALLLLAGTGRGGTFLLYLWKDLYIVVLIELFWSVANLISATGTARWTYGFYCFMGSMGGIVGNLGSGALAARVGTRTVLWGVVPVLGLAFWAVRIVGRVIGGPVRQRRQAAGPRGQALHVLRGSAYLCRLLLVVALVQVVITLIDFQYNAAIEAAYPDTDARTAIIGKVYASIDLGSIALQFLTGPILRLVGVGGALLGVPVLLGGAVGAFLVTPRLVGLLLAKVLGKCFDYSIFRAAKEMLYIPLRYDEKVRGKALIDVLTYRVAKGLASLLLLVLTGAGLGALGGRPLSGLTLGLIAGWIGLTVGIVRRYHVLARAS